MSETAFEEAARLLSRRVGLRLDHNIRGRLARAVRDEAESRDQDLADFVSTLDTNPDALQALLNRVTVQETAFFRDPGQFHALANEVLPGLKERGGPVRIWSAGCANGQEAYSLAMTLAESGIDDWQVIASDISTKALSRTRQGHYAERELSGLSASRRAKHLVAVENRPQTWEVTSSLRQNVRVTRHNLVSDTPPFPPAGCDVVFCRNVLIYFDRDSVLGLLDRLNKWLPFGGYLFLGYSESLWQVTDAFRLVRLGESFVYRSEPSEGAAEQPSSERAATSEAPSTTNASATSLPSSTLAPAPTPATVVAAAAVSPPAVTMPTSIEALALGEAALDSGDYAGAVVAFRRAVYLEPDDPVAYLNLGLALEASADGPAARRAFTAGRAALDRCDVASVEAALEGYHLDELTRLLDHWAKPR